MAKSNRIATSLLQLGRSSQKDERVLYFTAFLQRRPNPTGLARALCNWILHIKMSKKYCILQCLCYFGNIPQECHELVAAGYFITKGKKSSVFYMLCSFCPIELATPHSPKLKHERPYRHQAQNAKPNLQIQLAEA